MPRESCRICGDDAVISGPPACQLCYEWEAERNTPQEFERQQRNALKRTIHFAARLQPIMTENQNDR